MLSFLLAIFCVSLPALLPPQGPPVEVPHIRYFGFAMVDAGFDDPLDSEYKTNYLDEVAKFCNTAQLAAFDPAEDITARLDAAAAVGVFPILHVQTILFATSDTGTLELHADYAARWQSFVALNSLVARAEQLACIYPVDEPVWNGVSAGDLAAACSLIDQTLPETPILIIEAPPVVDQLIVPIEADWIGFDLYGTLDPNTDETYQALTRTLRSRKTRADQKIVVVMETQWLPQYGQWGVQPGDMAGVAVSYTRFARRNKDVVAIIGYLWPGGFDQPDQLGARHLPPEVIEVYGIIGRWISGK